MEEKHYKIIRLTAKNFKRLRAVEINPDGSLVRIVGENESGKSSTIDAIWAALGGKKGKPDKPIRDGEERAVITLDLGDLIVTRTFTPEGSSLSVRNKDGMAASDPQHMLDKMIGAVGFDPFEFARLSATAEGRRKQAATLAKALGLDFSEMNIERKMLFEKRTEVNRELKSFEAALTAKMTELDGYDEDHFTTLTSIEEVIAEQKAAQEKHRLHTERVHRNGDLYYQIQSAHTEIAELEAKLEALRETAKQMTQEYAGEKVQLDIESSALPDLATIETKLRTVNDHNEVVRGFADLRMKQQNVYGAHAESDKLTGQIMAIDLDKKTQIESAQLPIEGLVFDEDGISVNNIPFEQCSASQQLKIATAIAMKLNPQIRVLRILDGSLLDAKSMEIVKELADQNGFQVWIEVVEDGQLPLESEEDYAARKARIIASGDILIENGATANG